MDPVQAKAEAQKVEDGVRTVIDFIKRPAEEQVAICREAIDAEIGSDVGALLPTIPGVPMPASFVETISDPLLDTLATLVVKVLTGKDPAEPPTPGVE
jgi:hypothetical protein